MAQVATIDTLRSLAFGSISGNYAAVGSRLTNSCRLVCFTNNTDADMFFSTDGINNMIFVAKGAFKLFDLSTNGDNVNGFLAIPQNTQFYVKQSSAPGAGSVYNEVIYGTT